MYEPGNLKPGFLLTQAKGIIVKDRRKKGEYK
jgi:hypothetical protein